MNKFFTALVSVATAEAVNIIVNVTTISVTRASVSVPVGDVVPRSLIGYNIARSVNAAEIAPPS